MPYIDHQDRLAYQRDYYRRNREKVIAKVAERKHTIYAGTCMYCGGPTTGQSKGKAAKWCNNCRKFAFRKPKGYKSDKGGHHRWMKGGSDDDDEGAARAPQKGD